MKRGLQRDVVYLGWPIASLYMSPNAGGGGGVAGSQSMSTAVNISPIWISNSIFNLWTHSMRRSFKKQNPDKSLAIHGYLYSFSLRFLHISSNSRNLLHFLQLSYCALYRKKEKKPDGKPYPLPYGLRNSYRNLKSENFQDYVQKPQRNCMFMNSASV